MNAIILAAGMSSRLRPITSDKPKCMLKLFNETLLERQIKIFRNYNINDITIVTGYRSEVIDISNVNYVKNENYETTNINESLFCALEPSNGPILVTYSDIVFEQKNYSTNVRNYRWYKISCRSGLEETLPESYHAHFI